MPIVNLPPNPPKASQATPKPITITTPDYRHGVVDSRVTPSSALLTHIEGMSWIVDYYSQVLGGDEELSEFQPNQIAPYQQYHLIHRYELKLQDSLNTSINEETGVASITGTAVIYPFMTPNTGDPFIADVGDGRAGQFTITSVTPKSIFKQTCYEINFELSRFVDEALVGVLATHVVQTSYYDRDFILYGQNPVITSEELAAKTTLQTHHSNLMTQWMVMFYSQEFRTFLVPGQVGATYDPYVVRAMFRMYNQAEHPLLQRARELNVDGSPHVFQHSFWDALLDMNPNLLFDAFHDSQLIPIGVWLPHAYFDSIRFSGVQYVVGAKTLVNSVDRDYAYEQTPMGTELRDLGDFAVDLASLLYNNVLGEFTYPGDPPLTPGNAFLSTEIPAVHAVALSEGYFLSAHYYADNAAGMSKLELMLKDFFNTGYPNRTALYGFCESARSWGRLEKFYYIPVLLALLKISLRSI